MDGDQSLMDGEKSLSRFGEKWPENVPQGSGRIKNRRINWLIIRDMKAEGRKQEAEGFPLPVETQCIASLPPTPIKWRMENGELKKLKAEWRNCKCIRRFLHG
jgi:hypothetical protein